MTLEEIEKKHAAVDRKAFGDVWWYEAIPALILALRRSRNRAARLARSVEEALVVDRSILEGETGP